MVGPLNAFHWSWPYQKIFWYQKTVRIFYIRKSIFCHKEIVPNFWYQKIHIKKSDAYSSASDLTSASGPRARSWLWFCVSPWNFSWLILQTESLHKYILNFRWQLFSSAAGRSQWSLSNAEPCVRLGYFGPSNESKFSFSTILLKNFLLIHINLAAYAHRGYFQRCVQYEPQRSNFWAQNRSNIPAFGHFLKKFLLVSH